MHPRVFIPLGVLTNNAQGLFLNSLHQNLFSAVFLVAVALRWWWCPSQVDSIPLSIDDVHSPFENYQPLVCFHFKNITFKSFLIFTGGYWISFALGLHAGFLCLNVHWKSCGLQALFSCSVLYFWLVILFSGKKLFSQVLPYLSNFDFVSRTFCAIANIAVMHSND